VNLGKGDLEEKYVEREQFSDSRQLFLILKRAGEYRCRGNTAYSKLALRRKNPAVSRLPLFPKARPNRL